MYGDGPSGHSGDVLVKAAETAVTPQPQAGGRRMMRRRWQELPQATRQAMLTASAQGCAHPDAMVAAIAADYAHAELVWMRQAAIVTLASLPVVVLPVVVFYPQVTVVLVGGWLAVIVAFALRIRNRPQLMQLRNAGRLPADGARWAASTSRSTPPATAVVGIRLHRRSLIWICLVLVFSVTTAASDLVADFTPGRLSPYVLLAAALFAIGVLAATGWRELRDPTVFELGPNGWRFPHFGLHGRWEDIRALRVRAAGARARMVILDIDPAAIQGQPQPPWDQRLKYRTFHTRYGTPTAIPADTRITNSAEHILDLLRAHTNAPVDWGVCDFRA